MTYIKTDRKFINAFAKHFITHLSIPYDPSGDPNNQAKGENPAQKMVLEAETNNYGKISRIFDELGSLPCVTRKQFKDRLEEAGSIQLYMKPIIDDVAKLMLDPDKSRLNNKVIEAIGFANYARLVGGKVVTDAEGKPRVIAENHTNAEEPPTIEEQRAFVVKEAQLATAMLESLLPCYAACFSEYNLLSQQRMNLRLSKQVSELSNVIIELEGSQGNFKISTSSVSFENVTLSNFNSKANVLLKKITAALSETPRDKNTLIDLVQQCEALRKRGAVLLDESNAELADLSDTIQALGILAASKKVSILDLKAPEQKPKPSFAQLKEKVETLLTMLN